MPSRPRRPCAHPGCPALVSSGYCAAHAKQRQARYDDARGSASERGYDARWSHVRRMQLAAHPLCLRCARTGRVVPAVLVHHRDRDPGNNMASNLESLCAACHQAEHKEERWRGSARPA